MEQKLQLIILGILGMVIAALLVILTSPVIALCLWAVFGFSIYYIDAVQKQHHL